MKNDTESPGSREVLFIQILLPLFSRNHTDLHAQWILLWKGLMTTQDVWPRPKSIWTEQSSARDGLPNP